MPPVGNSSVMIRVCTDECVSFFLSCGRSVPEQPSEAGWGERVHCFLAASLKRDTSLVPDSQAYSFSHQRYSARLAATATTP